MAPKSVGKAMKSFQSAANPRILTFTSAVCIFESKIQIIEDCLDPLVSIPTLAKQIGLHWP